MNNMYDCSVAKNWTQLNKQTSVDLKEEFQLGKLGTVHRAFSFLRNQMVYLKILPKDQASEKYIGRLQQHINLDHPYVLGYYGSLEKEDKIYLLFQYCPNDTLEKLIEKRLSQREVLRLFRQLVEGLRYMHLEKRLLKELKPQHILIGPEEDIKLCDIPCFWSEKKKKNEQQEWEAAIYGAPQLLLSQHQPINQEKAQVWSVGLIVYQMLSGQKLLKEFKNYDSLKNEWLKFQRGSNINLLKDKYHPLWNSILNSILTFSADLRPTLEELFQRIALIYKPLSSQLSQAKLSLGQLINNLNAYYRYTLTKYDILLNLCESFTSRDIRLCNEYKYLIMFCCIMRYLSFQRTFMEKIKKRHITINNENIIDEKGKDHPYYDVILKQVEVIIEQKSFFYQHQIKNNIIPKILHTYCQRTQSQIILNDLCPIVELIKLAEKGNISYQEEQYEEGFKLILAAIERRHGDVTKYYNLQQLKIYHHILNAMLLSENYPAEKFQEWNLLEEQQNSVQIMTREQLIEKIQGLASQIF